MICGLIWSASRSGMLLVYTRRLAVPTELDPSSRLCQPIRNCSFRETPAVSLTLYSSHVNQPPNNLHHTHQADFQRACPSSAIMLQIKSRCSIHSLPCCLAVRGVAQLSHLQRTYKRTGRHGFNYIFMMYIWLNLRQASRPIFAIPRSGLETALENGVDMTLLDKIS